MALKLQNWNYLKIWGDNRIIQNQYTLTAYVYENEEARDNEKQPEVKNFNFNVFWNIPANEVERIAFWYNLLKTLEEFKEALDLN